MAYVLHLLHKTAGNHIQLGAFAYLRKKNRPMRVLVFMFVISVILTILGICG